MKILVSACLLGENCKYNGKNNYSERVAKYLEGHEVIPVCPEVLGGLPTPAQRRLCGSPKRMASIWQSYSHEAPAAA